jgi:hypothetical protein
MAGLLQDMVMEKAMKDRLRAAEKQEEVQEEEYYTQEQEGRSS